MEEKSEGEGWNNRMNGNHRRKIKDLVRKSVTCMWSMYVGM